MRRFGFIIICILVVTLFSVNVVEGTTSSRGYTLEEIDKIVIQNNRQTVIDDLNIKAREIALEKSKDTASKLGDAYGADNVLNNRIIREIRPVQAESDLQAARMTKQYNLKVTSKNAYKAAMEILLTKLELNKENLNLISIKDKYLYTKAKYSKGLVTENDLDDAADAVESQKDVMADVQSKLDSVYLTIRGLMNLTLDYIPVLIDGKLTANVISNIDMDKTLKGALAIDINVYKKEEALKAAEKTMELTGDLFRSGDLTYDTNALNLEIAKSEYAQAKIDLEVKVRNAYNDLQNKKDDLELAQKYLKLSDKKVKSSETKLKQGKISKESFSDEKNKYLDAEYSVYKAIYNYNVSAAEFKILIQ